MAASGVVATQGWFGLTVVHLTEGASRLAGSCVAVPHTATIGTAAGGGGVGLFTAHLACESVPLTVTVCGTFGVGMGGTLLGTDSIGGVPQALGGARCGGGVAGTSRCTGAIDGPTADGIGCAARQVGKSRAGGVAGSTCRVVCTSSIDTCGGIIIAILTSHLAVATLDIPSAFVIRLAGARGDVGLACVLTHDVPRVPHTLSIGSAGF